MLRSIYFLLGLLLLTAPTVAQTLVNPLIKTGGGMYAVPEAEPIADEAMTYKIVADLSRAADKPDSLNPGLDRLARLVNLHIAAGISKAKLDIVAVIHNVAGPVILSDEAYRKRFGMANPNTALINELAANGVKIYICGQTLYGRKLNKETRNPNIRVAKAALLVLTTLELKGYAPISL